MIRDQSPISVEEQTQRRLSWRQMKQQKTSLPGKLIGRS